MNKWLMWHGTALAAGVLLDLLVGDPHGIPHPVVAIGRWIACLERWLFPAADRREPGRELRRGCVLCALVLLPVGVVSALVLTVCYRLHPAAGVAAETALTCYLLAARSLRDESMKVYRDLREGELAKARADLSMIVGRDTGRLTEAAVARAAVETVAENTSDGVIAPLLAAALGGPVLGLLYKGINTMDSMVGYRNERYESFGRAAARLDDAVNYLPSRLSALLMIAAARALETGSRAYSGAGAWRIWRRDRRNHRSPNSAQTESACAGALGLMLGGPSTYRGVMVEKPTIGDALREIETEDIRRANRLMFVTEALAVLLIGAAYGMAM